MLSSTTLSTASASATIKSLGYSPDKAACEGFFGRLKTDMFFSRDWLSTTIEEFVTALDAYTSWYNGVRIKSSLGFLSPIEHRSRLEIAV